MKKIRILPVLLMVWPYLVLLVPLFAVLFPTSGEAIGRFMQFYFLLTIPLVYLANILLVCFSKSISPMELAMWNLRLKLVHIPFYLLGFCLGFAAMILAPGIAVLELILMLTTSAYGIRGVIRAKKQRHLSRKHSLLLILGHCFFVIDVLSALILYHRIQKQVRQAAN